MIGVTVTTIANRQDALDISKKLVKSGLIACAQIERIESIYVWEDTTHHDEEYRVTMKHSVNSVKKLRASILAIHPYDVPEVITWEVNATPSYHKWVESQSV